MLLLVWFLSRWNHCTINHPTFLRWCPPLSWPLRPISAVSSLFFPSELFVTFSRDIFRYVCGEIGCYNCWPLRTKLFPLALNGIKTKYSERMFRYLCRLHDILILYRYLSDVVNRMSSDPSTVTRGEGSSPWPTAGLTPTNHSSSSPTGNVHLEKLYCFT